MSASYDLFCRWKHVQKIQSDNAGALALGVSRATVSLWKQGKNAEIHYIERMAVDIGDSPEMWSAVVMAERSNSEDEKAAWRRIAQKLATVIMAICLFVGTALPRDVQAMPQAGSGLHDIHYAKFCIGLWPRSCPWRGNGVSTSALRYWAGWHAARYGIELVFPVPEATVLQFVVDHVQRRSADGELA